MGVRGGPVADQVAQTAAETTAVVTVVVAGLSEVQTHRSHDRQRHHHHYCSQALGRPLPVHAAAAAVAALQGACVEGVHLGHRWTCVTFAWRTRSQHGTRR